MNLPNSLTLLRIFLVPLLLVVLLTGRFPERELLGCIVFIAAAITDYFDGYLARKRWQVTTMGTLLDPIADKLLVSAALVSLVELGIAPAWMVVVVIGREFAVTGLRSIASAEGFTISASPLGKYKMASQVACVSCLLVGSHFSPFLLAQRVGILLLWVVVLLASLSMVQYFRRFWGQVDESIRRQARQEDGRSIGLVERRRRSSDAVINT